MRPVIFDIDTNSSSDSIYSDTAANLPISYSTERQRHHQRTQQNHASSTYSATMYQSLREKQVSFQKDVVMELDSHAEPQIITNESHYNWYKFPEYKIREIRTLASQSKIGMPTLSKDDIDYIIEGGLILGVGIKVIDVISPARMLNKFSKTVAGNMKSMLPLQTLQTLCYAIENNQFHLVNDAFNRILPGQEILDYLKRAINTPIRISVVITLCYLANEKTTFDDEIINIIREVLTFPCNAYEYHQDEKNKWFFETSREASPIFIRQRMLIALEVAIKRGMPFPKELIPFIEDQLASVKEHTFITQTSDFTELATNVKRSFGARVKSVFRAKESRIKDEILEARNNEAQRLLTQSEFNVMLERAKKGETDALSVLFYTIVLNHQVFEVDEDFINYLKRHLTNGEDADNLLKTKLLCCLIVFDENHQQLIDDHTTNRLINTLEESLYFNISPLAKPEIKVMNETLLTLAICTQDERLPSPLNERLVELLERRLQTVRDQAEQVKAAIAKQDNKERYYQDYYQIYLENVSELFDKPGLLAFFLEYTEKGYQIESRISVAVFNYILNHRAEYEYKENIEKCLKILFHSLNNHLSADKENIFFFDQKSILLLDTFIQFLLENIITIENYHMISLDLLEKIIDVAQHDNIFQSLDKTILKKICYSINNVIVFSFDTLESNLNTRLLNTLANVVSISDCFSRDWIDFYIKKLQLSNNDNINIAILLKLFSRIADLSEAILHEEHIDLIYNFSCNEDEDIRLASRQALLNLAKNSHYQIPSTIVDNLAYRFVLDTEPMQYDLELLEILDAIIANQNNQTVNIVKLLINQLSMCEYIDVSQKISDAIQNYTRHNQSLDLLEILILSSDRNNHNLLQFLSIIYSILHNKLNDLRAIFLETNEHLFAGLNNVLARNCLIFSDSRVAVDVVIGIYQILALQEITLPNTIFSSYINIMNHRLQPSLNVIVAFNHLIDQEALTVNQCEILAEFLQKWMQDEKLAEPIIDFYIRIENRELSIDYNKKNIIHSLSLFLLDSHNSQLRNKANKLLRLYRNDIIDNNILNLMHQEKITFYLNEELDSLKDKQINKGFFFYLNNRTSIILKQAEQGQLVTLNFINFIEKLLLLNLHEREINTQFEDDVDIDNAIEHMEISGFLKLCYYISNNKQEISNKLLFLFAKLVEVNNVNKVTLLDILLKQTGFRPNLHGLLLRKIEENFCLEEDDEYLLKYLNILKQCDSSRVQFSAHTYDRIYEILLKYVNFSAPNDIIIEAVTLLKTATGHLNNQFNMSFPEDLVGCLESILDMPEYTNLQMQIVFILSTQGSLSTIQNYKIKIYQLIDRLSIANIEYTLYEFLNLDHESQSDNGLICQFFEKIACIFKNQPEHQSWTCKKFFKLFDLVSSHYIIFSFEQEQSIINSFKTIMMNSNNDEIFSKINRSLENISIDDDSILEYYRVLNQLKKFAKDVNGSSENDNEPDKFSALLTRINDNHFIDDKVISELTKLYNNLAAADFEDSLICQNLIREIYHTAIFNNINLSEANYDSIFGQIITTNFSKKTVESLKLILLRRPNFILHIDNQTLLYLKEYYSTISDCAIKKENLAMIIYMVETFNKKYTDHNFDYDLNSIEFGVFSAHENCPSHHEILSTIFKNFDFDNNEEKSDLINQFSDFRTHHLSSHPYLTTGYMLTLINNFFLKFELNGHDAIKCLKYLETDAYTVYVKLTALINSEGFDKIRALELLQQSRLNYCIAKFNNLDRTNINNDTEISLLKEQLNISFIRFQTSTITILFKKLEPRVELCKLTQLLNFLNTMPDEDYYNVDTHLRSIIMRNAEKICLHDIEAELLAITHGFLKSDLTQAKLWMSIILKNANTFFILDEILDNLCKKFTNDRRIIFRILSLLANYGCSHQELEKILDIIDAAINIETNFIFTRISDYINSHASSNHKPDKLPSTILVEFKEQNQFSDKQYAFYESIIGNKDLTQYGKFISKLVDDCQPIQDWSEIQIKEWAISIKSHLAENPEDLFKYMSEIIAVINKACLMFTPNIYGESFELRWTQILALTLLLNKSNDYKGRFAEMATGEGKSFVLAALAIIRVLMGDKVAITTSSKQLAMRDSEEFAGLYQIFGILTNHNHRLAYTDGLKDCYKDDVDIVYGVMNEFEFDYLRRDFNDLDTMGNWNCDSIFIDEVDNILVDNSSNLSKLAESISGMNALELLYIHIFYNLKEILHQEYNFNELSSTDQDIFLKNRLSDLSDVLVSRCIKNIQFEKIEELDEDTLSNHEKLFIPMYLHEYIKSHLPRLAKNAIMAMLLKEKQHYIIKKDEYGVLRVKIIDKENTGEIQSNAQWDDGLHQFIQIKEDVTLTPETLTTNYIYHNAFIEKYATSCYGLTATLGNRSAEQKLLDKDYQSDSVFIPSFKPKQHVQYPDLIVNDLLNSDEENDELKLRMLWQQTILEATKTEINRGRAVLIICSSIEEAEELYVSLENTSLGKHKLKLYTRDDTHEANAIKETVHCNDIIITTNLGGRGTHLKLDERLLAQGGMHVIMNELSKNKRVDDQGFGRSARKGEPGSGQLIIKRPIGENKSIEKLKSERDIKQILFVKDYLENKLPKIKEQTVLFKRYCLFKEGLKVISVEERELTSDSSEESSSIGNNRQNITNFKSSLISKYKLKALDEQWGFWLKQHNDLTIDSNEKEDFDTFCRKMEEEFRDDIIIKNYSYYLQFVNELIKDNLDSFKGKAKNRLSYSDSIKHDIEKALNIAKDSDPIFAYNAYCLLAYSFLRSNEENAKDEALASLNNAKYVLEKALIPQLKKIPNISQDDLNNSNLTNSFTNKLRLYSSQLDYVNAAINTIEKSQKRIDFVIDNKLHSNYKRESAIEELSSHSDEAIVDLTFNALRYYTDIGMNLRNDLETVIKGLIDSDRDPEEVNLLFNNISKHSCSEIIQKAKESDVVLLPTISINNFSIQELEKYLLQNDYDTLNRFQINISIFPCPVELSNVLRAMGYIKNESKTLHLADSEFHYLTLKNLPTDKDEVVNFFTDFRKIIATIQYQNESGEIIEVKKIIDNLVFSAELLPQTNENLEDHINLIIPEVSDSLNLRYTGVTEENIGKFTQMLDENIQDCQLELKGMTCSDAKFLLRNINVPEEILKKPSLKPIDNVVRFTSADELNMAINNGLASFLVLNEKAPRRWCTMIVLGSLVAAQVTTGALLTVFTGGIWCIARRRINL